MEDQHHPARLLISSSRKPVSYVNLAKRFLQEHGEVQLSALGVAISSMVTLAEILKNKQLAVETRVVTSLEEIASDSRTRHKPKMSVVLVKSPQFDDIIAAEGARAYAHDGSGIGALSDAAAATGGGGGGYGGSGGVHHLRGGGDGGSMSGTLGGSMHPGPSYGSHDGGNNSGSYGSHRGGGGNSLGPPPYRQDGYLPHHMQAPGMHDQPDGYLPQHAAQYRQHHGDVSPSPAYSSGHRVPLPAFGRHQFSGGGYGGQVPDEYGQAGLAQPWTDVLPLPLPLQDQPPGSQHPYLQQQMLQQQLAQQLSGMHGNQLPQQLQSQQPSVSQQQQQQLVQQLENLQMGQQQQQQQQQQQSMPSQSQAQVPSSMPGRRPPYSE